MSKNIVLSLILVSLLASCGGKDDAKTEDEPSISDAISAVSKLDDVADASKNIEKQMEELKKLTPLTNDQLKSTLPESMGGIARTSFEVSNAMTMHLADAKYEKDPQNIRLQVLDGAGEMGASMVAMTQMATAMGSETESQTGYTKPVTIGNAKGIEKLDKSDPNNVSNEIVLVVADRFTLTVNSRGIDMEALKTIIKDSKVIDKIASLK
jgi:hypothetical protein